MRQGIRFEDFPLLTQNERRMIAPGKAREEEEKEKQEGPPPVVEREEEENKTFYPFPREEMEEGRKNFSPSLPPIFLSPSHRKANKPPVPPFHRGDRMQIRGKLQTSPRCLHRPFPPPQSSTEKTLLHLGHV